MSFRVRLASSNIAFTSPMPELVALSSLNIASTVVESRRASVVLPQLQQKVVKYASFTAGMPSYPGGPHRIMLPIDFDSTIDRSRLPSPVRCS